LKARSFSKELVRQDRGSKFIKKNYNLAMTHDDALDDALDAGETWLRDAQNEILVNRLLSELGSEYSDDEVVAIAKCCLQLAFTHWACMDEGYELPLSLEKSMAQLIKLITSSAEMAWYFGFYLCLEFPDLEDPLDNHNDTYSHFVQEPSKAKKRMKDQGKFN